MRSLVKVMNLISRFKSDENGAALIEYTVLLAILIVAVIVIITGVGKWVSAEWASLSAAL
jgi:pilus assembly protein Flp/PilA